MFLFPSSSVGAAATRDGLVELPYRSVSHEKEKKKKGEKNPLRGRADCLYFFLCVSF